MFYKIEGQPIPLSRARIGYGARHMFDSQKNTKRITSIHIQNQHGDDPILTKAVHLDITFFMKMPKLSPKARANKRFQYHYYKADLSNLIKFVEDIAIKVIYNDDCQIAIITARKVYHDHPRTEFYIHEVSDKYRDPNEHPGSAQGYVETRAATT